MIRILLSAVAALLLLVASPSGPVRAQQGLATFETSELTIETAGGPKKFKIELALSSEQQTQGLMFRRTMAADAGMLFIYGQPQEISMWMRNTFIPLDMVFIDPKGRVLRVAERAVPQSLATIGSGGPARAVLEINAGTAQRLGIKPGDRVVHPMLPAS